MLLYPFPALVTLFPRTFFVKGSANNGKNPLSCPFPALLTPFPLIVFINEEATGCINEQAIGAINEVVIGAIIPGGISPSCFLFHVLLFH